MTRTLLVLVALAPTAWLAAEQGQVFRGGTDVVTIDVNVQEKIDSAIKEYDTVLRSDPEKPYSLYGRGMAKRRKGDVTGGEADMLAAKAIKPDIAEKFAEIGVRPGDP